MTKTKELSWISGKRYVLMLAIDGNRPVCMGRYRRREGLCGVVERLNRYKGLDAFIVDTKPPKANDSEEKKRFKRWCRNQDLYCSNEAAVSYRR